MDTKFKLNEIVNTQYGKGKIEYFTYKLEYNEIKEKVVDYFRMRSDVITTKDILDREIIQIGVKLDNTPERFKNFNPKYNNCLFFSVNEVEKL